MGKTNISERKVILYTAGLVVFTGLIRLFAYSTGTILFYLAFAPFITYRLISIFENRKKINTPPIHFSRVVVLVIMIITIVLNAAGWQEADFFLIFLLMVDYLLVINKKF